MPRFSIIVIHYQPSISHELFLRGIRCLQEQTFRDFEVLCYHDGPLTDPTVQIPIEMRCSATRFNDWGHSLRDRGIREATGDYIIHFNADNVLYPHALETLERESRRPPMLFNQNGQPLDNAQVLVYPVKMFGMVRFMQFARRFKGSDFFSIFTGNPPVHMNIDCMQLVMLRQLWLAEGGWADKSEESDGKQYQRFAAKYGYRGVGDVLGEHH